MFMFPVEKMFSQYRGTKFNQYHEELVLLEIRSSNSDLQ